MYRDGVELRTADNINFLLTHGALGDAISSLPPILWARKVHDAALRLTAWVPEHLVALFKLFLEPHGIAVKALSGYKAILQSGSKEFAGPGPLNSTVKNQITRNRFDMVEYAFATLLDRQCDFIDEKNYPTAPLGARPLDDDYVVLPVGATNQAGTFQARIMAPLIEWIVAHDLKPVLLGKRGKTGIVMIEAGKTIPLYVHDKVNELSAETLAKCVDMRDRTTLIEARDWLGHAQAVVGIDGGTLHLAGTTDVPIVYACTRVDPRHRGIVRNGEDNWNLIHVVPRDLECAGCQSNWTLMFHHSFADCGYGDFKCTSALHADDFIEATDILLRENENA